MIQIFCYVLCVTLSLLVNASFPSNHFLFYSILFLRPLHSISNTVSRQKQIHISIITLFGKESHNDHTKIPSKAISSVLLFSLLLLLCLVMLLTMMILNRSGSIIMVVLIGRRCTRR